MVVLIAWAVWIIRSATSPPAPFAAGQIITLSMSLLKGLPWWQARPLLPKSAAPITKARTVTCASISTVIVQGQQTLLDRIDDGMHCVSLLLGAIQSSAH